MRKLIITSLLAISLSISGFSFAEALRVKPNAPARYTVKKGDTLWGISGRYLYKQWNWPKLWGWNKSQIRNPHLIYPGQVLVLTYVDGQPRLGVEGGSGSRASANGGTIRPHMRIEDEGQAINGISYDALARFYKRPMIISAEEFAKSARIVSGPESRLVLSKGDRIYARGITEAGTYASYKPNKEIFDPDTKKFLGFEVTYGGDAVVQKLTGDVQTMEIVGNDAEIMVGDRLLKITDSQPTTFVPHAYEEMTKGKVVSFIEATAEAGQFATLTINLGAKNGIENGQVFGLYRSGNHKVIEDVDNKKRVVELPSEEIGVAMVYRTYDNLAYAVVMATKAEISIGNLVGPPGLDMEYFDRSTVSGNDRNRK